MLRENLGEAHRKHAYQLMCNELKIGHVKISLLYMVLQLAGELGTYLSDTKYNSGSLDILFQYVRGVRSGVCAV